MAGQEKDTLTLAVLALAAALLAPAAHAIEVEHLDVRYRDGRYIVDFHAQVDAPPEAVGAVLTDFERYPQLDARILESKRIAAGDGKPERLVTRLRGCVGVIICRSMRRVEALQLSDGEMLATAIPKESDVRFGRTESHWKANGEGTDVTYRLEIIPDFWVPPMIGRRLMLRTMRDGTMNLFRNVERAARKKASS